LTPGLRSPSYDVSLFLFCCFVRSVLALNEKGWGSTRAVSSKERSGLWVVVLWRRHRTRARSERLRHLHRFNGYIILCAGLRDTIRSGAGIRPGSDCPLVRPARAAGRQSFERHHSIWIPRLLAPTIAVQPCPRCACAPCSATQMNTTIVCWITEDSAGRKNHANNNRARHKPGSVSSPIFLSP